jgi:hypothetical protein
MLVNEQNTASPINDGLLIKNVVYHAVGSQKMAGKICRPNPLVVVQFIGFSDMGCEASNDIITQFHNDHVIPRTKHSVSKKKKAPLRGLSSMHLVHIMQVRH